jgi:hypothetical protein
MGEEQWGKRAYALYSIFHDFFLTAMLSDEPAKTAIFYCPSAAARY